MTHKTLMRKTKAGLIRLLEEAWGEVDPPVIVEQAHLLSKSELCKLLEDITASSELKERARGTWARACGVYRNVLRDVAERMEFAIKSR